MRREWMVPTGAKTTIVFVHGAVVNGWEMAILRKRLRMLGYQTRQFRYYSMVAGMEENCGRLKEFLDHTEGDVVHVVAHSMGGVVTRNVFERQSDPRPGRLVAVGSPFLDCWIGRRSAVLGAPFGPGRTVRDHIAGPLDPVWRGQREFGVLAGILPIGIGMLFPDFPQPNDGVVRLEETRLQGIAGHVTYRINHFGMLLSRRCCTQIARFLATGHFKRTDGPPRSEDNLPALSPT
jgi:pimeloyl-ACP methyl ester carboxylesterase